MDPGSLTSDVVPCLVQDLQEFGIRTGDQVLVRAALRELSGPQRSALLEALLRAVGTQGLVLGLSFSTIQLLWSRQKLLAFCPAAPVITGGFVSAMLAHPEHVRTRHPTNSFVGIGKIPDALRSHGPQSFCFEPVEHLVNHGGKMLLVGCTQSSPGFSTVHLAQHRLGLSRRTWLTKLSGNYYRDASGLHWYSRADVPGCSRGFGKFYDLYRRQGVLQEGRIGNAPTYAIGAAEAYAIESATLARNPTFALCDNEDCLSCRVAVTYKWPELATFLRARVVRRRSTE